MQFGIIGLPNVGKSTLFNALTNANAAVAKYPFTTIHPNIGVVAVPDERLTRLGILLRPPKLTPTFIEFVDIAGLVKGASKGEGLGNRFLGHIREVDAVLHVVRCFVDSSISYHEEELEPIRDIEIVETELSLADLETVEKNISRAEKAAKSGDRKSLKELGFLQKVREKLVRGEFLKDLPLDSEEETFLRGYHLLMSKPVLYVANVGEEGENRYSQVLRDYIEKKGLTVVMVSAKIESELSSLKQEERHSFREEMGLKEESLENLIRTSYKLLDLVSFYTIKGEETKAWSIQRGTKISQAAGKIHSDMEKGFVKAEVVSFETLSQFGSLDEVKERGLLRIEGRDYVVQDGDIILIRFAA